MFGKYILKDGNPVLEPDVLKWAAWFEEAGPERIVERTTILQGDTEITVSTVFLGLDHNYASTGLPRLWETIVFGKPDDEIQERYTSRAAAKKGHDRIVRSLGQFHV